MTALKFYVERGLGIALVPEIVLNPAPIGTTIRAMIGDPIDMSFGILTKASEYPLKLASSKLYQFLKQELLQTGFDKRQFIDQSSRTLKLETE